MSITPMQKLKQSFTNFENLSNIRNHFILQGREEKTTHFNWDTITKKAIETDFMRIYKLPPNEKGLKTLSFNIDYLKIDNSVLSVSIKNRDDMIISSEIMDFESFKSKLNALNKTFKENSTTENKKSANNILNNTLKIIVEHFGIHVIGFDEELIKEQVSKIKDTVKIKVLAEIETEKTHNTLESKKTRILNTIKETPEYKELKELEKQKKEIELKIQQIKNKIYLKENELKETLSVTQLDLNFKNKSLDSFNDVLYREINKIKAANPKSASSFIDNLVNDLSNELKTALIKEESKQKRIKKLNNK